MAEGVAKALRVNPCHIAHIGNHSQDPHERTVPGYVSVSICISSRGSAPRLSAYLCNFRIKRNVERACHSGLKLGSSRRCGFSPQANRAAKSPVIDEKAWSRATTEPDPLSRLSLSSRLKVSSWIRDSSRVTLCLEKKFSTARLRSRWS